MISMTKYLNMRKNHRLDNVSTNFENGAKCNVKVFNVNHNGAIGYKVNVDNLITKNEKITDKLFYRITREGNRKMFEFKKYYIADTSFSNLFKKFLSH